MTRLTGADARAVVDAIVRARPMPPGYRMVVLDQRDVDEAYLLLRSLLARHGDPSAGLEPIGIEKYRRRFASAEAGWSPHGSFSLGIRQLDDGHLVATCSWDMEYPGEPVPFVDLLPGVDRSHMAYGCSMAVRRTHRRSGFARLLDATGRACLDTLRMVAVGIVTHTNRAMLRTVPDYLVIASVPDSDVMGEGAWAYYQATRPAPGATFVLDAAEPFARVSIHDPAAVARWLDGRAIARYDGAEHFEIHPWVVSA